MYIRLQDSLINLDLIKEVDPVTAHHYKPRSARPNSNREWMDYEAMDTKTEARMLVHYAAPDSDYQVMYCIKIWYIMEQYPKVVKLGNDRIAARKLADEFEVLINNNNPNIPHLKT